MTAYRFKGLLQKEAWVSPAYVRLEESGKVLSISNKKEVAVKYININGYACLLYTSPSPRDS